MKKFGACLWAYLIAILWDGVLQKIFTFLDVLSLFGIIFPRIAERWLSPDNLRIICIIVLFATFLIENFLLYKKQQEEIDKLSGKEIDEGSLLLYPHFAPPYSALKMLYVGNEVIKDVEITQVYVDKDGNKIEKSITDFFPSTDKKMVWESQKINYLRPQEEFFFHVVLKKSTRDGKVTILAKFTGAISGKSITKKIVFQLNETEGPWLA